MAGKKKPSRPIPPGAPGHPRTGTGATPGPRGKYGPSAGRRDRPGRDEDEARGGPLPAGRRPAKGQAPASSRGPAGGRPSSRVDFLYEDDDLVVVVKPAGLPVIAAEGSRAKSLYDVVTDHIRRRNPKGRAAVVHRLDRESSGVLVFAKNAQAKKVLMAHWDELAMERVYVALAEGEMEGEEGRFDSWLAESGDFLVRVARAGERGALRAVTDWRVIGRGQGFSLLELSLETGRKHQIRAQLAGAGHPIAGDVRYGSRSDPAGRLCLHAIRLVLRHPATDEVLRFESEAPAEFAAAMGRRPAGASLGRKGGDQEAADRDGSPRRPKPAGREAGRRKPSGRDASPSASPAGGKSAARPRPPRPRGARS